MKHILEYDEADIRELIGDLRSVGQTKDAQFTLWFENKTNAQSHETFTVLTTLPFATTGDEVKDSDIALKMIADGEFEGGSFGSFGSARQYTLKVAQEAANDYYRDRERYGKISAMRGKGETALHAFCSDLAYEFQERFGDPFETGRSQTDFKGFIANPGEKIHQNYAFFTLPNPVDQIEYLVK
jgi:hypothetical protein